MASSKLAAVRRRSIFNAIFFKNKMEPQSEPFNKSVSFLLAFSSTTWSTSAHAEAAKRKKETAKPQNQ